MGYFKVTIKSISWMGALRGSTRLIAFLKIAILARLLTPSQFGVFGVALLALASLEVFTETGINVFLIQGKAQIEEYLNTAWIVSIFRGALISVAIYIFAPLISTFFNSPQSLEALRLISLVPLLRGFINPAIVQFQKKLEFNKEFLFRFSIFSFDALVAIVLTFLTRSAISLVWGLIAGAVMEIFLSFVLLKAQPRLSFEFQKVKKIIGRGKWVTLAGVFNYAFRQGDDVVVGRLMNTSYLGLYQMAYKISTLPINEVGEVFGKVTFPIYTKIADDSRRLKKAFLRVSLSISALVIPFGLVLFFFPKEVILLILGDKWLEAVPVIRILSVFGVIRAISGSSLSLFLAVNKQEYVTALTLVSVLGLAVTIVPLVLKYGVVGAAYSAVIGSLLALPVILYFLAKVFRIQKK